MASALAGEGCWQAAQAAVRAPWSCGSEHDAWPPIVRVHSANPVGIEWLTGMADRYGPGITRH